MTTTRVLVTALPHSLAPKGRHLTAFVTLKLDPGAADGVLSDFPAAAAWVDTLTAGTWELLTDSVAQPLPLSVVSAPSSDAWAKVFPGDTRVAGYPKPQVSAAPWQSFPASRLPDHAVDLHVASLTAAPTRRPGVLSNPAVAPILDRLGQATDSIQLLRNLAAERAGRADRLLARRLADSQASLGQGRRVEGQPEPTRNGLEVLFDDEGADERTTKMLDAQLGQDLSGDPAARALVDAHAARRYYERPQEQVPYQEEPTPGATTPRPVNDPPDFHQRAASLGATPVLLRELGLAVDLALAPGDRTKLADATWVAVRFTAGQGADVTRVAPPHTRVSVSGQRFEAVSSDAWVHGAVPLGNANYVLLDLDPDASGLKLDQHLRALPRLAASEVNGDDASSAPGSLRTSGFAVARTDRVDALRSRTKAAEDRAAPDDAPGVAGPLLMYDDVVRGLRLEVWDDRTRAWHSLHERLVTVRTDPGGDVLVDAPDTGFLQGSSLNRVPGDPKLYAHEVVAGWDGWSLSAPRPGLVIEHQADGSEKPVEQVSDEPASGVHVTSRVAPGSLPRLRWGWRYAFRLVGVDLAGDSVPRPSGPAAPARAAIQAATAHLAAVSRAYQVRDRASLLSSVRASVLAALPDPDDEAGTVGWASEPPARARRVAGASAAPGTPAAGLRTRAQRIDAFVPLAVRTGEVDVDAALADRIAAGAAGRVASPVAAAFEQVAKAARTLGAAADGLRVRPQLAFPPAELAPVFGADDPAVVTVPRPYLRWAPVPPPTLVATAPLTTGEQLSRLVIRSGLPAQNPDAVDSTARHVVPPKTTQLDAETAGLFDGAIGSQDPADHKAALPVALAERGTLLDEVIQDLGDANATRNQPDMALASRPGADPATAVTLAQITANRDTPLGEGQYVVHAVEDLVLPYLPDPHAAGVALVFYDAGAEHTLAEPRALQAVVLPFPEEPGWPRLEPLRLLLTGGPVLGASLDGRTVRVTLPAGEQVRVAMSSSLRPADLDVFGLWRSQPAAAVDPATAPPAQVAAAAVLARAAAAGWTWWLTPSTDLRLVHAVPAPVVPPRLLGLKPLPRPRDLTVAPLVGLVDLHGASTERLVVRGDWEEWVDDVASAGPQRVSRSGVLTDSPVGGTERFGLLWLVDFQPFGLSATSASLADGDIGLHKAIATFPDTHHRVVAYTPTGTTRYAEMFAPSDLPAPDDPALAGDPVTVDVPSSARPAAAEVLDAVPLLRWSTDTEPEHPFALRRVRRSGIRVWLARPWYSSGDGELLGVVLGTGTGAPAGAVSLWGRDPISIAPQITAGERPPLLEAAHLLVEGLSGVVVPRSARPVTGAVPLPLVDAKDAPALVFGYEPEYDEGSGRWFVDIALDDTPQLWPFVRLAVARYQPSSIAGCELSPVALTTWVQPLPTRTATVSRPDADHVRVTVTGTVSFVRTVRSAGVPDVVDADTPTGALALLDAQVSATRTVTASLQRLADGGSDLQWETVTTRRLPVVGVQAATYRVTWSASLALPDEHGVPLATPGASERWRVLIDEAELLDADAPGVANVKGQTARVPRTVYLDTVPL